MKKIKIYLNTVLLTTVVLLLLPVLSSAQRIAGGNNHSMALCSDNTVMAWGFNSGGQLGNGTDGFGNTPPGPVSSLPGVISISAAGEHSLALKNDGTVWAWGYGGDGELGNGTNTSSDIPVQVSNLTGIIKIAAGGASCYGLKNDGTVWAWGYNSTGQLGNGNLISSNVPVQVSGLSNVIAISAGGFYAMALKNDGSVWAWGDNAWGALGNGGYVNSSLPGQVGNLSNVIAISGGNDTHALALISDGTVWAWGLNSSGQLGIGSTLPNTVTTPMQVSNLTNVIAISGGNGHSLALKNDGTAWAWGWNAYGQLGNGNNNSSYVPIQVNNLTGIIEIEGGRNQSLALKNDGTVWGWGDNQAGQLGNGTLTNSNIPVQVTGLCPLIPLITSPAPVIAAGAMNSYFICSDHTVRECGVNSGSNVPIASNNLSDVIAVKGGGHHALALKTDGTVWAWGANGSGQLGNGVYDPFTTTIVPAQVSNLSGIVAIAAGENFSLALKNDGTVWGWGANAGGQLGDGTDNPSNIPVQASINGVTFISAGKATSTAIRNDGTVWNWGNNQNGQLSIGNPLNSNVPVPVNTDPTYNTFIPLSGVIAVATGAWHSMALKHDGTVWIWGSDTYGEHGNGAGIATISPTVVPGLTGIIGVTSGGNYCIALKNDGTLWGWGANSSGQLGDGTNTDRDVPVQTSTLSNVIAIAAGVQDHTIALKNDNTFWAWGDNSFGQLGIGTNPANNNLPVQVVGPCQVTNTYYADNDADGYGDPNNTIQALTPPPGYLVNNEDCNDNPALGGASVHPGATEVCNGIDDDCDGLIDEGVQLTFYRDADTDGYGNAALTIQACSQPAGYVNNSTDCNDANAAVHPGATEVCNGIDDDCDGLVDEGVQLTFYRDADTDGFGNPAVTTQACTVPAGYVNNNTDCNDANAAVHPGATEICNGIDDDCDGLIDEGVTSTFYRDADTDGFGNAAVTTQACTVPAGYVNNNTDCNDANAAVHPGATEICNGIDDDCDGSIDEGVQSTFYRDADTDGYGNAAVTTQACTVPAGYVNNNTDCNDANAAVHPGATELCNGIDDDCDGLIDEGVKSTFYRDADTDGYGNAAVTTQACTAPSGYVSNNTDCNDNNSAVHPGAPELCNGVNDDCNGQVDEGCAALNQSIFKIESGAVVKTSGAIKIVLENINMVCDGILAQSAGEGTFKFTGTDNNSISGGATPLIDILEIAKTGGSALQLQSDFRVGSFINFTSGLINLNASNILLQTGALLNGESENSHIIGENGGYVEITQPMDAPALANPGNLGAIFTSTEDFGSTVIRRGHQQQYINGQLSIKRYFDISPANNSSLNATLRLMYFDTELNGVNETAAVIWKSQDHVIWSETGFDNRSSSANYVEKTGISDFSRWTLANGTNPLKVMNMTTFKTVKGKFNVKVIPNPSPGDFTLQVKSSYKGIIVVKILDVSGRLVKQMNAGVFESLPFGAELKQGVYFLEVRQNNNLQIVKLIKL